MVSWGVNFPHKNDPIPLWLAPNLITSKSLPPLNLYALPSRINMTTMIRQNTKFPPTARSPRQIWSPGYSLRHSQLLTTIEGKRHYSHLNHCIWYLFDLNVTGSLSLSQRPFDSECSALTHFSVSWPVNV